MQTRHEFELHRPHDDAWCRTAHPKHASHMARLSAGGAVGVATGGVGWTSGGGAGVGAMATAGVGGMGIGAGIPGTGMAPGAVGGSAATTVPGHCDAISDASICAH